MSYSQFLVPAIVAFVTMFIGVPVARANPPADAAPITTVVFVADGLSAAARDDIKRLVLDSFLEQPPGSELVYVRARDSRVLARATLGDGSRRTRLRAIAGELVAAIRHLDDAMHGQLVPELRGQLNIGTMPAVVNGLGAKRVRVVMIGSLVDHSPERPTWSMRNHRVPAVAAIRDPMSTSTFCAANIKALPRGSDITIIVPPTLENGSGESQIHAVGIAFFLGEWAAAVAPEGGLRLTNDIQAAWEPAGLAPEVDSQSPIVRMLSAPKRASMVELPMEETRADDENAAFFGVTARGTRLAFVIDASGSMDGKPFERATRELETSLARLPPTYEFAVYFYAGGHDAYPRSGMLEASPENIAAALREVAAAGTRGGTNHFGALVAALNANPQVLFLLTDADAGSDIDDRQISELTKIAASGNVRVELIKFARYNDEAGGRLAEFVRRTGGNCIVVNPDPDDDP